MLMQHCKKNFNLALFCGRAYFPPKLTRPMSNSAEVLFEEVDNKGIITLNRTKALNALNLTMIRKIYPKLKEWEHNKALVIIKGSGDKAFCAGGDVLSITKSGKEGGTLTKVFFREEYLLNCLIGTYHIPYIALIDGITMGGGVGLSIHGCRLKGRDLHMAGLATHLCDSLRLAELEEALIKLTSTHQEDITKTIQLFHDASTFGKDQEFSLKPFMQQIQNCFQGSSMEEIIKNLEDEGSEWSIKQIEHLSKMSPTSLKITFEAIKRGADLTFQNCLSMEYRLTQRCCADQDFYEGVRAILIDRDNAPKWKPNKLSEVSEAVVKNYFSPLSSSDELIF